MDDQRREQIEERIHELTSRRESMLTAARRRENNVTKNFADHDGQELDLTWKMIIEDRGMANELRHQIDHYQRMLQAADGERVLSSYVGGEA